MRISLWHSDGRKTEYTLDDNNMLIDRIKSIVKQDDKGQNKITIYERNKIVLSMRFNDKPIFQDSNVLVRSYGLISNAIFTMIYNHN